MRRVLVLGGKTRESSNRLKRAAPAVIAGAALVGIGDKVVEAFLLG